MPPDIGYFDLVGFDPRTDRAQDPRYDKAYDALEVFNGTDLSILSKVEQISKLDPSVQVLVIDKLKRKPLEN